MSEHEFHCDLCGSDSHDTMVCRDTPVPLSAMPGYRLGYEAALRVVRLAATEWCHGEATSDQSMSAVLGAVGCQTCESEAVTVAAGASEGATA